MAFATSFKKVSLSLDIHHTVMSPFTQKLRLSNCAVRVSMIVLFSAFFKGIMFGDDR